MKQIDIKIFFLFFFLLSLSTRVRAQSQLEGITIQSDSDREISEVSGFSGASTDQLPLSSRIFNAAEMQENRVHRLSDLVQFEASASDSYNATGYWDFISIRGFTLGNRDNYQREGLPISAETSIALDNKERIEILKGLSGVQAGASSPGGLVNYVVKRPPQKSLKNLYTEFSGRGNLLLALDFGGRLRSGEVGYRVNLAQEKLSPNLRFADGSRSLVALAADWRLREDQLLEAELEWSLRSQPSQAGFSLLGNRVPDPGDPNLNLNNQPWSQPVVFAGLTGTLRYSQIVSPTAQWVVSAGSQSLTTDDRLAYPFGCSSENSYDRFCSDGTFDLYDYRSEDEKRTVDAIKIYLSKQNQGETWEHSLTLGVLASNSRERFQRQAYNFVGTGNVQGTNVLPADPSLTGEGTHRDSSSTEIFLNNSLKRGAWHGWFGLRYGQLHRGSVRTDGSRPTNYSQNFALPWAAVSYDFTESLVYISWGQGLESFVVPNKSGYLKPGEFVPDVLSEQIEAGIRGGDQGFRWNVAAFTLRRPVVEDQKPLFQIDGWAQHQGIEVQGARESGPWTLAVSAMILDAQRRGATLASTLNGRWPSNVPESTLRGQLDYRVPGVQGLALNTRISREGERAVLPDNSLKLPAWIQWDVGGAYALALLGRPAQLSLTVENVTDQRFWRESPIQYGHVYFYSGEARNIYLSLQTAL